jgi:hypothetical protein
MGDDDAICIAQREHVNFESGEHPKPHLSKGWESPVAVVSELKARLRP